MKIKISLINENGNEVDYITRGVDSHLTLRGILVDLYLLLKRNNDPYTNNVYFELAEKDFDFWEGKNG